MIARLLSDAITFAATIDILHFQKSKDFPRSIYQSFINAEQKEFLFSPHSM